ncbi:MAG: RNA 2',3'-cyclic phosphodiesterase [Rhodobacteraceae bacterium]|nr:RNA 2',3'-cyclic phosphodiesterase [Paracoccaceae bacterium]
MIRCFAAIDLPGPVRDRLAMLSQLLPLPRRLPPENLHLTLAFLGEIPEPVAEEAHLSFAAIRAEPFALELRGLGLFGGGKPRLAYAGVAPEPRLDRLQAKVEAAARRAGAPVEARRFVPHVTLARFRPGEVEPARLEHAILAVGNFAAGPFPVESFALFRSRLGRGGSHYEELARYPLG